MYALPRYTYQKRSSLGVQKEQRLLRANKTIDHQTRVVQELRRAGVSRFGLSTLESQYLFQIIHPYEEIGGVVYGYHNDGFAMLVATELRVIFLDKKLLFVNEDEINYDVVSGVSFSHSGFICSVTLHTRIKDYTFRTFNKKCTKNFVEYIESRCLEHKKGDRHYDLPA